MLEFERLMVLHNYYQRPGGEDAVFDDEAALLEARGHQLLRYTQHNDRVSEMGGIALARSTVWSRKSSQELRALIREFGPQVAHFHNTFPLISPSAYYAARAEGVPVVQTLHNYRLLCPNALFFRDGGVCEDCLGRAVPWPGVLHGCYRGSRAASGAVAAMLSVHRLLGTWREAVDVYVALTEFERDKFVEGGLPEEKVVVKPNFVHPDPGEGSGGGGYAMFVGRLSREKGLDTLLGAWERLGGRVPLRIVGDGPLAPLAAEASARLPGVEWLGRQSGEQVLAHMKQAAFLVFPSKWYEGLPRVIVEARAVGLPIIGSDMGSMPSLIDHGRTGLLFRPGDAGDLAARVGRALSAPEELAGMRRQARAEYEGRYTAGRNYEMLAGIYRLAAERAQRAPGGKGGARAS